MPRGSRLDTGRVCAACGGSLDKRNTTGFCKRTFACRQGSNMPKTPSDQPRRIRFRRLLPEVKDEHGEVIIDDVAIEITILGTRPVALTPTERMIVVRKMMDRWADAETIAAHIGVRPTTAKAMMEEVTANER